MTRYNACEDLLDRNLAEGRGDKLAFVDPARSITYGDLARDSRKFANILGDLGVRREQRIALAMLDTVDWPVAFLGAIRAGVIPVCLNTLLSSEQYAYMLADSRAKVLLVSPALLPALRPALAQAPDLAHVIVVGPGAEGRELDFASLMSGASDDFAAVDTHPDETAFWLYSSGSTGAPKGTKHVHTSLMDTARLFGQAVLGLRADDVVHSAAKLFFAYGLGNSLSFPMSVGATTILNPDRPTPATVFDILAKRQPTIFCGVPTLFAAMLHDPAHETHGGSPRLRLSTSAGEALPDDAREALEAAEIRDHRNARLAHRQLGVLARETDVAGAHEVDAAADAPARDRGDGGLAAAGDRVARALEAADEIEELGALLREAVGRHVGPEVADHRLEIEAVAEVLALALQDHDPHVVARVEIVEHARALLPEVGPEGVALAGAEQGHGGDVIGDLDLEGFHRRPTLRRLGPQR